jgi:very-short-patch-repair endonuclease
MNTTQVIQLFLSFWPIYVIIFVFAVFKMILESKKGVNDVKVESPYDKKQYIFDSVNELNLYKTLLELFSDKYNIFTQVNYSHLIQTKDKTDWGNRSRIDKKSADFVLCDKEHVVPKLIIELDGYSHSHYRRTQDRDEFIDKTIKDVGLEIIHFKNSDIIDKEFIRIEIINKLNNK